MDMSAVLNLVLWLGVIAMFFLLMLFFQTRRLKKEVVDKETGWEKVMGEFEEPGGLVTREVVAVEPNGRTVKYQGGTYFLIKERGKSIEGKGKDNPSSQAVYPFIQTKAHVKYPSHRSLFGFGPQVELRLFCWDVGNPEPKRAFYGKWVHTTDNGEEWKAGDACDPDAEDAKFVDSRLMVTASEHTGIVNEAHLAATVTETERLRSMLDILRNLPSKMVIYIGFGLCVLGIAVCAMMLIGQSA